MEASNLEAAYPLLNAPPSPDSTELSGLCDQSLMDFPAPAPAPPLPGRTFTVLTYNIQCGLGSDDIYDPYRIARFLSSTTPDVVSLQELDRNDPSKPPVQATVMGRSHNDDQLAIISEELRWKPSSAFFVVKQKMTKKGSRWRRAAPTPSDIFGWGIGLLSPHPLSRPFPLQIPKQCSPFCARPMSQAAGAIVEHPDFGRTYVAAVHLMSDVFGALTLGLFGSLQTLNLLSILQHIEEHADAAVVDNVIICGDFNSFFPSNSIRTLLNAKGKWGPYVDCAKAVDSTDATCNGLRIDYVFVSSRSKYINKVIDVEVIRIPYSDHFPLKVTLGYEAPDPSSALPRPSSQTFLQDCSDTSMSSMSSPSSFSQSPSKPAPLYASSGVSSYSRLPPSPFLAEARKQLWTARRRLVAAILAGANVVAVLVFMTFALSGRFRGKYSL